MFFLWLNASVFKRKRKKGMGISMNLNKSLMLRVFVVIAIIVSVGAVLWGNKSNSEQVFAKPARNLVDYGTSYQSYLESHGYKGILAEAEVEIDLENYTKSDEMFVEKTENGMKTGDLGLVTWEFYVEEEGFYNMEVGYIALPGTMSDIQRKIRINDEIGHEGMQQVIFYRTWQDEEIKEKNGNEIRPISQEIYEEKHIYIEDFERRIGEPYLFFLKKGNNTVTFEVIKEPMELTSITFKKADKPRVYNEVIADLKNQYPVYAGEPILAQAERAEGNTIAVIKNSPSINILKNYSDSLLYPYHPYKIKYNTIGASSWKQPGYSISWDVEVEQEGLYEIAIKGRQSLKRGITSCRRISINDTVPYAEMNSVNFAYSSDMVNYVIADEEGAAYLFHLKAGSNRITLENVMGDFGSIISKVEESMLQLNQLYLDVIKLTGQTPDKYIDYQIAKKFPEFVEIMSTESDKLLAVVDELIAITGEKGENTSLLQKMALQAERLAKNPEKVTNEIGQLKENISALGTWLVAISEMPLEIDSVILTGEDAQLPRAKNNLIEKLYNGLVRFAASFIIDSSQVSEEASGSSAETITIWMVNAGNTANVQSIGREQAQIIQNMIDETFTPSTGISVNLQLIPVDVVLRAALAGNSPDVLIGLSQATLQDFAMRGAIVDLSVLEGYEEVAADYYPSTIDAASYMGGVYGIPEQADFFMLFYRKDILEEVGVEIPTTWEEVKALLPNLMKNNYEFFLPTVQNAPNLYPSLVYQFGGDLYQGEADDYGIASALGSDEAMSSFKTITDFFTNYGFTVNADFANRFRTGEMPIGVTKYTMFNQLEVFAPEIKGLWSFAPIPGYEGDDGQRDNTYVIETVNSAMLESSKNKENAWTFMKWWSDEKVQLQYANTVESVMGSSARYATANPKVMEQLPWSNDELEQLLAQMEQTVGIPAVPGSYMTNRMVLYAFNTVIAENANPREALYLNIKAIDKELTNKRREFQLSTVQ